MVMADFPCGSRLPRRALIDARGIFAGFVCDQCEERKRAAFAPGVLTDPKFEADEPIEEDE